MKPQHLEIKVAYESGIVLQTVHGSHLYGLNHAESDLDVFIVHTLPPVPNEHGGIRKEAIEQTIVNGLDATVLDFKTFSIKIEKGVPQALEALFSPKAEVDLLRNWREGYRVSIPVMSQTYKHAIEKFSQFDFKRRRHAMRYALNLRSAWANAGRFNPVLSESEIELLNKYANSDEYGYMLKEISPIELHLNNDAINEAMLSEAL